MKALFLIMVTLLGSVHAWADARTEILMDKVERMEAELALLERKLYQNPVPAAGTQLPPNIDEFYTQLDNQNQLIQELTEKVERLEFEVTTLGNRVDKMNADVDFRLSELTPSQEAPKTVLNNSEKSQIKRHMKQPMPF